MYNFRQLLNSQSQLPPPPVPLHFTGMTTNAFHNDAPVGFSCGPAEHDNPLPLNDSDTQDAGIQLKNVPTMMKKHIVVIDSRDRNTTLWPTSSKFQVLTSTNQQDADVANAALENNIRNVKQIELNECILPNFLDDFPYLLLKIPEIQECIYGTNNSIRTAFAVLVPERIHGDYITCKTLINGEYSFCKQFDPPLVQLPTMTIEVHAPEPDVSGDTLYPLSEDIMIILNVCTEEPNKSLINYKIIT